MVLRIFPTMETFTLKTHCKINSWLKQFNLLIFPLNYQQLFVSWKRFLHYPQWTFWNGSLMRVPVESKEIVFSYFKIVALPSFRKKFTAALARPGYLWISLTKYSYFKKQSSFEKIRYNFCFLDNLILIEAELLRKLYSTALPLIL